MASLAMERGRQRLALVESRLNQKCVCFGGRPESPVYAEGQLDVLHCLSSEQWS